MKRLHCAEVHQQHGKMHEVQLVSWEKSTSGTKTAGTWTKINVVTLCEQVHLVCRWSEDLGEEEKAPVSIR